GHTRPCRRLRRNAVHRGAGDGRRPVRQLPHAVRQYRHQRGHTQGQREVRESGAVPYNLRSPEQIGQCIEGLEMVEPGLVSITQWRPNTADVGKVEPIDAHGAVARKP
ncbi:MAG: SAM-dependent methyltransferase, partial [Actinomadura sp.]